MGTHATRAASAIFLAWLVVFEGILVSVNGHFNYKDALTKSLIFLEAQRSGKLPPTNRVPWRGDSALDDGKFADVDLVGGYYDAGDNVKYGLPMAFTVTTLSWAALFYNAELRAAGELENVHSAIRWGTDFFLKAASRRNRLYVQDELLWAATWLYVATKKSIYLDFIREESISANVAEFSWDLKYAGAQILLTKLHFEGEKGLEVFKNQADSFVCSVLPESPYHQVYISPGGLIHMRDGANTQYVTGTALLFSIYSDILAGFNQKVYCGDQQFHPARLWSFAKQQLDYVLGNNPNGRSYMVGFGANPPTQAHHRGASVPKLSRNSVVNCGMSFVNWYNKNSPNVNELTGAILGGPDRYDNFDDKRWDSSKTEPCTYINSLAVGVLAKLASHA
ncbi:hypothetical protein TIFTF001_032383 [Ficus carica]|uniref:Endoglucanase n=1 Tax=Ficus carica TaxID=3494 RepID=A0AA88DX40_FICCA|nr:hypothetical protein TIFTF001_032383 [Ficus carica]